MSCMKSPLPEPLPELPRSSGLTPPARPPSPPARLALDGDLDLECAECPRGKDPVAARLPLGVSHCLEKALGFSCVVEQNEPCLLDPVNADDRRLGVPGDSHLQIIQCS